MISVLLFGLRTFATRVYRGLIQTLAFLIEHPKVLLAVIVALMIAYGAYRVHGYVGDLKDEIVSLQADNKKLVAINDQLRLDIKAAKETNDNNQRVIDSLTTTSAAAGDIVKNLNQSVSKSQKSLSDLEAELKKYKAADNGSISKILKDTLEGIQKDRDTRWDDLQAKLLGLK